MAWRRTDLVPDTIVEDGIPGGVGFTAGRYRFGVPSRSKQRRRPKSSAAVDAYGYTQARRTLQPIAKLRNCPPCTPASGCLRIVNAAGPSRPASRAKYGPEGRLAPEQALDLDAISAACPKCKIVMVHTSDSYSIKLAAGDRYRRASHARQRREQLVGGPETGVYIRLVYQPGHVIVASAGDNGGGLLDDGGPTAACTLSTVVCAGGTSLVKTGLGNPRGWRETVWNTLANETCGGPCGATGSGCKHNLFPNRLGSTTPAVRIAPRSTFPPSPASPHPSRSTACSSKCIRDTRRGQGGAARASQRR